MGMLLILTAVVIVFIIIAVLFDHNDVEFLAGVSMVIAVIALIWLVIHVICWSTASYNYRCFVAKRNAFEQTLHDCRATGNQYETATIVKEVSDWNETLAEKKIDLNTFVYGSYEVEEILTLKPIK